ncbi:MAG: alkaline phosphatase family protein [Actinomycetota bacterium]
MIRSSRRPLVGWMLAALVAASCTEGSGASPGAPAGSPTLAAMADALGADVVEHLARGYVPERSGEIVLVPEPWTVVGQWNRGLRGARDPRTTHATPWSYHVRVPIVLWGPGFVHSGVRSDRSVNVADLAPTFAELLGLDWTAPDGRPLREALVPPGRRAAPPAAIVLVAFDGAGWNVLDRWRRAWPTQRRLANRGTAYLNATVGSSPSVTAPVHANMGTGTYPRTHGLSENTVRMPDGSIGEIYFGEADPRLLASETVADAWDRSNGNRPWVGMVGFESWHLGMMGAGARAPGGDRDAAVLWEREEFRYWANERFYRLPPYLPDTDDLFRRVHQLDRSDGAADGTWLGNRLGPDDTFEIPGTPAFVRHVTDTVAEILRREPVGHDDLTDLLFVEYKSSDYGGHLWNMLSAEVGAVVAAQDRALDRLVRLLDRRVGRGRYVLALTSDHGQTPIPETRGGVRVDRFELERDLRRAFGTDVVESVHPSEIYVDMGAVRRNRISVKDVARWVADYRYRDGVPEGADLSGVPRQVLDRRVFAAALPGAYLASLRPSQIEALGASAYAEGDLRTPPPVGQLLEIED